jgi:lipopolysaccharide transport system permease protein
VPDLLRQTWESRHLFRELGSRLLSIRFARTKLGRAWFIVRPVMEVFGMSLLFGGILSVSTGSDVPYLIFLVFALAGWRFFQYAVYWATLGFDRYARLMRNLDFPLLPIPIASTAVAVLYLAVYLAIGVALLVYYLVLDGKLYLEVGPGLLWAVLGFALCAFLAWGVGLFTSVWNAHTRDVRFVIRYVLQFWFFLTPVVYPLSQIPSGFQTLAQLNPMTAPIDLIKEGMLGIGQVDPWATLYSVGFTLTLCTAGIWFFSRRATNFMGPTGWEDEGEGSRRGDDDDDDMDAV